jgi:hypothetical protein
MNISINYLAVVIAAIAGAVINTLWYSVILKARVSALRAADPTIAGRDPRPPMYSVAVIGQLVMALVLALMLELTNLSGIGGGALLGVLLWLGFTIPAMAQVQTFGYRQRGFILIDGANWLIAAAAMGAIIAAFG